ncbi:MAG: 50S ribosomal protein L11 methyltransferase [Deltaproteobacteria bacterium]|nr:50S ribosomal protein L11 methyltransferase [Deltaproteobacteria bacterium]
MPEITDKKLWMELQVETHPTLAEAVSNFLIEQGSHGVVQEELPGTEQHKRERIIAYFPKDRHFVSRRQKIRTYLLALRKIHRRSSRFQTRIIKQEEWAEAWKSNFKTIHVTPRLVIKPPWEEYPTKKGEVVVEIDPAMAFGTGTHPTTQMCLRVLERLILSSPHSPSILDVGTGSGILAIASRKMGAKKVLAIDIDPLAIACARKNAAANNIDSGIDFRTGFLGRLRRIFNIIVANLLPQELLSLAPYLAKRISPGGALIISGLLRGQKKEVISVFAEQGLEVWRSLESKGWACLMLSRKNERDEASAIQN